MLTTSEKLLFVLLVAASVAYAYTGISDVIGAIRRGQGEQPSLSSVSKRAWAALQTWLLQGDIWKMRTVSSAFHALIAWGFVFYFLVNVGDVVEGYLPVRFFGANIVGDVYRLLADLFSGLVLLGMVYFLWRRFVAGSEVLTYRENVTVVDGVRTGAIQRDSMLVGLFILGHVGFRLLGASFAVALRGGDPWQPAAMAISQLWQNWPIDFLEAGHHVSWWMALGLILLFLPYFPYTKHFHLVMSGVNFLTKPRRSSIGALTGIDFEDETIEEFGVERLEQLPWTNLVDAYACIMCNRCQDACPAYVTGKELSPAALEVNKRLYLNQHLDAFADGSAPGPRLLDFAISESALWACTACGACIDVCPVGNEPMFDILYMRRHQMLMENSFPSELQTAYRGMERNGNPWNQRAADRLRWAEGLQVRTVAERPHPELLWWVGCAPAYDPRAQATARALATILDAAGVDYAILGDREQCTGDSARRSGNEYLFHELATMNVETLNEVNPPRIVTTCPHCLHTLRNEYGEYGGTYNVIHHSQLLSELVAAKKISVQARGETDLITFHDPCYLGRHNGIVDAPREALSDLGMTVIEMPRHGQQSFCCGAGGAQMWKEEEPGMEAVSSNRYREAVATSAETIAVGCPFCLTMMSDAANRAEKQVAVKDIAEVVLTAMRHPDE